MSIVFVVLWLIGGLDHDIVARSVAIMNAVKLVNSAAVFTYVGIV